MASLFIYATAGADDPTRAGLPFFIAGGAKEAGHDVEIALAGDATVLVKNTLIENIHPVGLPTMEELWQTIRDLGIPVGI